MSDEQQARQQALDQVEEQLVAFAGIIGAHYEALLDCGMSPDKAADLSRDAQRYLLAAVLSAQAAPGDKAGA